MALVARCAFPFVVLVMLAACSSASPPASKAAETPPAPESDDATPETPEAEPSSLEDAARSFDDAERELAVALAEPPREEGAATVPAPAPGELQPRLQPAPPAEPKGRMDRCAAACRALESMQRSAERLCELSEEESDRCRTVRERTERSRARVQTACPACRAARPLEDGGL
jgi:hypothetical protein